MPVAILVPHCFHSIPPIGETNGTDVITILALSWLTAGRIGVQSFAKGSPLFFRSSDEWALGRRGCYARGAVGCTERSAGRAAYAISSRAVVETLGVRGTLASGGGFNDLSRTLASFAFSFAIGVRCFLGRCIKLITFARGRAIVKTIIIKSPKVQGASVLGMGTSSQGLLYRLLIKDCAKCNCQLPFVSIRRVQFVFTQSDFDCKGQSFRRHCKAVLRGLRLKKIFRTLAGRGIFFTKVLLYRSPWKRLIWQ